MDRPVENCRVVADAGFISFALCQSLIRSNRSFVFRVAANMRLVEGLSSNCPNMKSMAGCDLTCLWPKEDSDQQPVLLRRVTVLNAVGLRSAGPTLQIQKMASRVNCDDCC